MEGDREEEEKTGGREIEKTQRKVLRGKRKERERWQTGEEEKIGDRSDGSAAS